MTTKHESLPSVPEGVESIPKNEVDCVNADSGLQNKYFSAYITDYGSTVPDIACDLYQRVVNPDGSQGELLIGHIDLEGIDQLITLLQAVRKEMHDKASEQHC